MMRITLKLLTGITTLCFSIGLKTHAQQKWQKIRSEDGVEVFFRQPGNSSYYEIKATTRVKTDIHALVALLKDAGHYDQWMHRAQNSRLLDTLAVNDYVYYLQTNLPWPAQDRDMVVRSTITLQPDGTVETLSRDVEGYVSPKPALNRVEFVRVKWRFTPISGDEVHVRYYTKFSPGIQAPNWLERQLLHVAPYQTLTHLRKQVKKASYRNAHFSFLQPE